METGGKFAKKISAQESN